MPGPARLFHAVHISALGVWLGSLILAGATAAIIFPMSKRLGVTLPDYQAYTGEHWRLAAGIIQARVFTILDIVQLVCCVLAVPTIGYTLLMRRVTGRAGSTIRVVALLLLVFSLTAQLFFLHPPMDTVLHNYWETARAGDNPAAAENLAAFEKFHGPATWILAFDALAVATALAFGSYARLVDAPGARA
jgi:hypothetical protein